MQQKFDVFIFEPNLDNRKPLAQLLPLSKFVIKFMGSIEELMAELNFRVPHILILSLDVKKVNIEETMASVKPLISKETVIIGLSDNLKSKKHVPYFELGLQEIWETPIAGLKIKPRINEIVDELKPISVKLNNTETISSRIDGEIVAMGEAEFIASFPLVLELGAKLSVKSEFLQNILSNEEKTFIVTENKHPGLVDSQITVTILGLKNDNLKNIRAKILNWEKL